MIHLIAIYIIGLSIMAFKVHGQSYLIKQTMTNFLPCSVIKTRK